MDQRTIAIRVEPAFYETLRLLAQLRGHTLTDELREALNEHIARKSKEVDLSAEAKKALDAIDADAATRRSAIQSLLAGTDSGKMAEPASRKGGRRRTT